MKDNLLKHNRLKLLLKLFKARKTQYYSNLKLALRWNRCDIAKNFIFNGEEEFKPYELANLMELALLLDRVDFVELLLENGANIKSLLSVRRLYFFYNSETVFK